MSIAFLNGEYLPIKDAKVSILDRGFLFSDGVYEVIPAYSGNYFRFEEHILRLNQSLKAIKLPVAWEFQDWHKMAIKLLKENDLVNATIYIQITRGVSAIRSHEFPANIQPTVMAMVSPLPQVELGMDAVINPNRSGISVITAEDIRWQRCDIKSVGLLANCLLLQQALESGADDTILVRNGSAIEATASNLFIVKDQKVVTPDLEQQILPGVTRDFVIMLVEKLGFELQQRAISMEELALSDEIWLTSSNKEIRPVVTLNGDKVGLGEVGSVWYAVNNSYQKLKSQLYQGKNLESDS